MIIQTKQEGTKERTKVCRVCWTRLPISRFRHVSRAKNTYHPECRDCRRECDRAAKLKQRRANFNRFCRGINERKTHESLLGFIELFCDEIKTTPFDLATNIGEYAQSDGCTPSQRIKIARSLLHINATAELAKAEAQPKLDEPDKVIRELHRTHRLLPTLREMFSEGSIGFDDIDPPPGPAPADDDF